MTKKASDEILRKHAAIVEEFLGGIRDGDEYVIQMILSARTRREARNVSKGRQ